MTKKRNRTITLTNITGITIMAAALVTAGITGTRAASPTRAAAHVSNAAAAAPAQGAVHVIKRGLVKDCVEIELENTGLQISDNGPYKAVSLEPTGYGSCWNLIGKYTKNIGGTIYTGHAYRDLRGDCLWDNGATLYTAPGPCMTYKSYQTFFGIKYHHALGWTFSDFYYGLNAEMGVATQEVGGGAPVFMWPTNQGEVDPYWNFP
jgi:hypothetical protein